jgi:hypothetical protein
MPFVSHPAIENLDENVKIVRFMTIEKFLSVLTSGSLYFARSSELGDEFEGKFPTQMIENIKKSNEHTSISDMWDQFRVNAQLTTYINCWSMGNEESKIMWEKFTNLNGVAIISTIGRIKASFMNSDIPIYIGPIKYGDEHLLASKTIGNEFDYWLWKRKEYQDECEVRCIMNFPLYGGQSGTILRKVNQPPVAYNWSIIDKNETPLGINIEVNLYELIDKIVVSPKSEKWLIPVMKNLIERYGLFSEICTVKKFY